MAYQSNYTGSQIDAGISKTTKMTADGDNITFAGKVTVSAPPTGDMDVVNKGYLSNVSGITAEIKQALLNCFQKVAWIDDQGQDYYDALYDALYPPVGLDSISCVYTQSGTVYDTDSLDSLKTDLVVTAHYSDQSTQTITTYTLSGSLTAGTSTITVLYGGQTTTFDVTVTREPSYVTDNLEFWLDAIEYSDIAYSSITDVSGNNVPLSVNTPAQVVMASTYCSQYRGQITVTDATFLGKLTNGFTVEVVFQNRYLASGTTPTDGGANNTIVGFVNGRGMIKSDSMMQLPSANTKYGTSTDLTTAVHTITVTYDNTTLKEYIDGVEVYSAAQTIDMSTIAFVEFWGNKGYSATAPCSWNAARVYSSVLTASEVSDNRAMDVSKYGTINVEME